MNSVRRVIVAACCAAGFLVSPAANGADAPAPAAALDASFGERVKPLLKRYCVECHSEREQEGELDLERFAASSDVRKDPKPWKSLLERVGSGEMPPEASPQPTPDERRVLVEWTRALLDDEARARAGDPGPRPLRRLSNAEYDHTIRDLTGVDLRPAREFPADGAAGEGFTNAAEALAMSPALMAKYFNAAKEIAAHATLLPDGFRFSRSKTQRDWVDESVARLRVFYSRFTPDGKLPLAPYLATLAKHRAALQADPTSITRIAEETKLSPRYLAILSNFLSADDDSVLMSPIRESWKSANEHDAAALAARILSLGEPLWEFVPIGSYRRGEGPRARPKDPRFVESHAIRVGLKPEPGSADVTLRLVARSVAGASDARVVWGRPRFEAVGRPPLLLSEYPTFGPRYEIDYRALFAGAGPYLAATVELAHDATLTHEGAAKKYGIDAEWLKRWRDVLNVKRIDADGPSPPGREVPRVELTTLDEKTPANPQHPAIRGWRPKGQELPVVLANSSDEALQIPGRIGPRRVAVHPTPSEFVAVVWRSPLDGRVRATARIAHAHPACGNGVAWRLETRTAARSAVLAEGTLDLGREAEAPAFELAVKAGEEVFLAIDARDANHFCDLTEVAFTLAETSGEKRVWDLASDVAERIDQANPLADRNGRESVWSFVRGPANARPTPAPNAASDSLLARWRAAASDPARQSESAELTDQLLALLAGPRPGDEKHPDFAVHEEIVSLDGPLLKDFDWRRIAGTSPRADRFGLPPARFGASAEGTAIDATSLTARVGETVEIRLPAELCRGRAFVVDASLVAGSGDAVVQFHATTRTDAPIDFNVPFVASPDGAARGRLLERIAEYRAIFPPHICYQYVLPVDEVVCLKTFHREDEPLVRLFLDDAEAAEIDRLWREHRFVSKFPIVENEYLPLFIGFVTQDQPKELVTYYEGFREPFKKRAEEFEREFAAAEPAQLRALVDFASRAYRRPLRDDEAADLRGLYATLRDKGLSQEQALRDAIARVLVAPSFLLHLETAPAGEAPGPVDDWALASRLSYFLWSSAPDDELRTLAAAGRLRDPEVLADQATRMLRDPRARALAVEFGTQWIHVRGFDEYDEKNETLFPAFDQSLKSAMYEEAILFFQDLFQSDRAPREILDADHAFVNETLAKHYGIPDVVGPEWRRVEGVKKYGRGGILGLASVQAKQSGASRTSPVLRGNWVVETLLGEKLPPPPPDVPQLPDEAPGDAGLTTRQLVEKHAKVAECAICHQRIDPFGFALEHYDAIGRRRDVERPGVAVDARAKLKDGTEFEGIDGLRTYLLTDKRRVIERLFCQRLLGYSLGRAVEISDEVLLDELASGVSDRDWKTTRLVRAIVTSPQFRSIRGADRVEQN